MKLCLRCDGEMPTSRSHFCPECRKDIERERNREYMKERRSRTRDVIANLPEDVRIPIDLADHLAMDLESRRLPEEVSVSLEDYLDAMGIEYEDHLLLRDKMPDGASSPYGPEEGRSTYFTDLADELDVLSRQASRHPWFEENPHWNYEIHDPGKASRYMRLG